MLWCRLLLEHGLGLLLILGWLVHGRWLLVLLLVLLGLLLVGDIRLGSLLASSAPTHSSSHCVADHVPCG